MNKSVIIRGKIFPKYTQASIDSIRKWHKGELILSTWKNQEENKIEGIDKLILSDDPGSGPVQQSNRQIVSYSEGLKNCEGDVILVTRSDIVHQKDIFQYFNTLKKYDNKFKIFSERLIVSNMMTIDPEKNHPDVVGDINKYFRVCDWFQVGYKHDLIKWIDVKNVFEEYKHSGLCTEQLWLAGLIKKHYSSLFDINDVLKYKFIFWNLLINNFHIINMKSTANAINLNWFNQPENLGCYLMEEKYLEIYNKIIF